MMVNPAVPARIRRLINVESGLNDGIATPLVLVAIAGAATAEHAASTGPGTAVAELALGLLIGAVVGGGGGWLVKAARRRGWVAEGFAGAAVLGLALCSYATSVALHGNGFIAAFTGGLAFTAAGGPAAKLVPFVEETGTMLSLLVWLIFGVVAVVPALKDLTWQTVLYAVLSLTVIRMLPVAVALAGTRLGRPAVLFIGWFGPRGLASVVFALLALEDLAEPAAKPAITVIAFTVLLSILAHGLTADPLASRYGPRLTPPPGAAGPVRAGRDTRTTPHPPLPAPAGPEKKEIADDNRSGPARGRPRRRIGEPARMPPSRQIRGNGPRTSPGGVPARPCPGAVMRPLAARRLGRFGRPGGGGCGPAWCSCCARWPGWGLACCCPGSPLTPRWPAPG